MKKATNSKLHFKKNDIAELSQETMRQIAGGGESIADFMPISTCLCPIIIKATRQF